MNNRTFPAVAVNLLSMFVNLLRLAWFLCELWLSVFVQTERVL